MLKTGRSIAIHSRISRIMAAVSTARPCDACCSARLVEVVVWLAALTASRVVWAGHWDGTCCCAVLSMCLLGSGGNSAMAVVADGRCWDDGGCDDRGTAVDRRWSSPRCSALCASANVRRC